MAEANPSKGDSGRTAPEQRDAGEKVVAQDDKDRNDYDKAREQEVQEANEEKQLSDGFVVVGGVVRAGTANVAATHFPGAERRGLDDDSPDGQFLKAYAEQQKAGPVAGWTAQSGRSFVDTDASSLPGQTFTPDELPDPDVLAAAGVAYTIPANLVVGSGNVTDNISAAQERAGTQKRGDGSRDKRTAAATSATSK